MGKRTRHSTLRIRVVFDDGEWMGPGKAELLEGIVRTGSIAAAGREMGMSYKRAWMLIETLNAMFSEPVVHSSRGGPGGGGAVLTETGRTVLETYRELENVAAKRGERQMAVLSSMLRKL
jgi:molybdate transport system regulatory protein